MIFKEKLEDYSEAEFLIFCRSFFIRQAVWRERHWRVTGDKLLEHFESVTEHPGRSDVIFYPEEGREDSPEGILKEVKEWRALNHKPGFKPG